MFLPRAGVERLAAGVDLLSSANAAATRSNVMHKTWKSVRTKTNENRHVGRGRNPARISDRRSHLHVDGCVCGEERFSDGKTTATSGVRGGSVWLVFACRTECARTVPDRRLNRRLLHVVPPEKPVCEIITRDNGVRRGGPWRWGRRVRSWNPVFLPPVPSRPVPKKENTKLVCVRWPCAKISLHLLSVCRVRGAGEERMKCCFRRVSSSSRNRFTPPITVRVSFFLFPTGSRVPSVAVRVAFLVFRTAPPKRPTTGPCPGDDSTCTRRQRLSTPNGARSIPQTENDIRFVNEKYVLPRVRTEKIPTIPNITFCFFFLPISNI